MPANSIVIADDDVDLVDALRKRCESLGMQVLTAHDAFSALNLIYQYRPDVVCLDVNMPSGNGLSVLEMVAHDETLASTPVIIMTGDANQQTVRRCYDLCAYYVEKTTDVWTRIQPLLEEFLAEGNSNENEQIYRARKQLQ